MIKKILTVLAVTFAMANSFAYEGFRFDDTFAYEGFRFDDTGPFAYPSKVYGNTCMLPPPFYPKLLKEFNLSFDGCEEVLIYYDAYIVLYNGYYVSRYYVRRRRRGRRTFFPLV